MQVLTRAFWVGLVCLEGSSHSLGKPQESVQTLPLGAEWGRQVEVLHRVSEDERAECLL